MKRKNLKTFKEQDEEIKEVAQAKAKRLDWNNIVKGIVWDGLEYKLKLNADGTIFADSAEETRDMPKDIVVEIMDLYDKDGNCVSRYKENR